MKRLSPLWTLPALALLLGMLFVGHAQEIMPIDPLPRPFPRPMPVWMPPMQATLTVENIAVHTAITDGVAQTDVAQTWRNETDRAQEGSYLFPIPEGATVSDFALYDGDKKMAARLLDKDEAAQTYESIVRQMRDPALLRYVGSSTYEVRLYPVPPHATRKITLRYTEVLKDEGGARKYVYSFLSNTMGANPNVAPPKETTVQVTVSDPSPLTNIYSPTQEVSIRHSGDNSATVTWEAANEKVKDDFILYYGTARHDPVGLSLLAYNVSVPHAQTADFVPNAEGKRDSGYFLFMASPKTELLDAQILPKRVVLVLDRSGSMSGPKIEQARGALAYVLNHLRPSDQFNVMTFNESNDVLNSDGLLPATPDNIKRGLAFVKDIEAEGGTNIHDALETSFQMFPADSRQNMVIFLTDGLPTVGETDQTKIIEDARAIGKTRGIRLFDFGVGYDVDVHFLDSLAQQNKGDSDYVRPEEDIEAKVSRFYEKVASPVLTDVQIDINGVKTADIYPRPDDLPDLFAGSQLLIAGRYAGQGPVTARLLGTINGKPASYALSASLPAVAGTDDFLPRLWATRKIGYLMDAIRLRQTDADGSAGNQELVTEVVRLSKEYGILTPYTSYLVTENGEDYNGGPVRASNGPPPGIGGSYRSQPNNLYGNISASGGNIARANAASPASAMSALPMFASPMSGAIATTQSQALHAAKSANVVSGSVGFDKNGSYKSESQSAIKTAGAKTFFLQNGVWTDSAYDPAKQKEITTVKAFSDTHFALLQALPALAAYSAVGDNVLMLLDNGRVLKIAANDGVTTLDKTEVAALAK